MKHENIKKKNFPISVLLIVLALFFVFTGSSPDNIRSTVSGDSSDDAPPPVVTYDFEGENAAEPWHSMVGDIRIQLDHENSNSGKYSLKTDERQTCFDGPAVDIIEYITPETEYTVSYAFMYNGPENDYIRLSVRKTYSDGSTRFENLNSQTVAAQNQWLTGEAKLTVPEDVEKAEIYFESGIRETTIWIDDISVTETHQSETTDKEQLKPEGTTLYDFEKFLDPGFISMRDAFIKRSDSAAFKGSYSLKVCSRHDSRDGVAFRISALKKNVPYRCSSQILYAATHLEKEYFSIYLRYHTSETSYTDIAVIPSHETSSGSWSSFGGIFTIPPEAIDPVLYITSVKPKEEMTYKHVDFYLDDFTISDELETDADRINSRKRMIRIISLSILAAAVIAFAVIMLISGRRLRRKLDEAAKDSMTGAYNRNAYEQRIKQLSLKPEKCKKLFFAVCDVNGLKYLNDNYGHQTGDQCIIKCAHLLLDVMKKCKGKVYRTGGDEFVCIAPQEFKNDLRQTLENEENSFTDYPFAVAAGTAAYSPYEDGEKPDIKEIIARCDSEMYIDKKRKQNKKIQN
jgi:diguanylate cyclase (GGDEF)-like protein